MTVATIDTRTVPGGFQAGDRLVIARGDQTYTIAFEDAIDQNYKGHFLSSADLNTAIPVGEIGWWAIVDDTGPGDATMYQWDDDGAAWINTGFSAIIIADNLTTNDANQALSARQGVVIKSLLDAIRVRTDSLQYTFENSIDPADVNTGEININNANIAGATIVTVSDDALTLNDFGEDWWSSVVNGSRFLMYDTQEDTGGTDKYGIYDVVSKSHQTTPDRTEITVTFVSGSSGTFFSGNNINVKVMAADISADLDSIGLISGIISGFDVTVNGGDPAKIDISSGVGFIVDWSTGSKVDTPIVFAGLTAVTITDIGTEIFTSLYIDDTGSLQQVGGAVLSNAIFRQNIVLDAVIHNDFSTVTDIAINGVQSYQYGNALFDYIRKLGPINDGNGYSSGGANLSIHKSAGTTTFPWINRKVDPQNPDEKNNAVISPLTGADWTGSYQDGSGGFTFEISKSAVDPDLMDDGTGTLAAVPNNRFTIKRFYFFGQNGQTVSTYGQANYQSSIGAEASIFAEAPSVSPLLATGTFVTALIIKKGVTDLDAAIISGDAKFVNITSQTSAAAGGAGAQDCQNTYDLSMPNPEVLTNSTGGAMTWRRGSALDTDDVIEVQNGAGTQTFAVTGAGDVTLSNILASNTTPAMQMFDTNASVDDGFWETTAVNNKLRHRTRDDAGANGSIYFVVNRTGTAVDTQQFLEGRVLIDDTTEATTTTNGSLQTDGGLSVVKNIVAGGDVQIIGTGISGVNLTVGSDSGGATITDATQKVCQVAIPHYTNAEESLSLINGISDATTSILQIGGGGGLNASTEVEIYAAANNTTTTGTKIVGVTTAGINVTGLITASGTITVTKATGQMALFGDSGNTDKYIQLRDSSAGGNFGYDSTEGTVGVQCGTSKGFSVKVNSDASFFDLASYDFNINSSGNATFAGTLKVSSGVGFFGTTPPTTQPGAISDPSGGIVQDGNCRNAVDSILDVLRDNGMINT